MTDKAIYTVGGTVQAGGGIYIKRKADTDLLELCKNGELAFVLSPRQVGKSSLMVGTAQDLEKDNIRSVIIDLSAIGVDLTVDEWYLGILSELDTALNLHADIYTWWEDRKQLGPTQRLVNFFRDVLLKEIAESIVIFIDEIDSTLSLPFTDDFFAALRAVYNARSITPDYKRLSFVLIGVASPGDLIADNNRTPFNIGRRIDLSDFTFEDILPLADGLGGKKELRETAIQTVFEWTSGHPYLTQRLCATLAKNNTPLTPEGIEEEIQSLFFGEKGSQDNNIQFVRDMLLKRATDTQGILRIYKNVLKGKDIEDQEQSINKSHLKLSGIVRRKQALLKVSNRIYHTIFNLDWVNEHLPLIINKKIVIAAIISFIFGGYYYWTLKQPFVVDPGDFYIAVAEFDQVSSSDLMIAPQISQSIFDYLDTEFLLQEIYPNQIVVGKKNIGVIASGQEAENLAQKINADIVIYGSVIIDRDSISIITKYYVADTFRSDVSELIGAHQLTMPILYGINDSGELSLGSGIINEIQDRSLILIHFTRALMFFDANYRSGKTFDLRQSMESIQDAIDQAENYEYIEGGEVLYLFASHISRLLGDFQEAQLYLDQAFDINPNYGRAYIELANIYYDQDEFEKAFQSYQTALELEDQPYGYYLIENANLGLGNVYAYQFQIASEEEKLALAEKSLYHYQIVIDSFIENENPRLQEMAALAYFGSGVIYYLQFDCEQTLNYFNKADTLTESYNLKELIQTYVEFTYQLDGCLGIEGGD